MHNHHILAIYIGLSCVISYIMPNWSVLEVLLVTVLVMVGYHVFYQLILKPVLDYLNRG